MSKTQKTTMIVLGAVGGTAALGALAVGIWNSKSMRTMRTVRKTSMILGTIGNTLCKISEANV